jgi:hypothetical protein
MPTVSPGCVIKPARASEIPAEFNSAPAVAIAVNLPCILPPMEMPMTAEVFYNMSRAFSQPPACLRATLSTIVVDLCTEGLRRVCARAFLAHVIVM